MKKTKHCKNDILIFPNQGKPVEQLAAAADATVVNAQAYKEAKIYYEAIDKVYPGRYSFESIYRDFIGDQIELNMVAL